jgi:ABC-2 type transport system permease protein
MNPIIRTEVRRRKWSIFWWSVGIVALIVLTLAFYPSIRDQQAELNKSFSNLSPTVTDLFSDTGEFFSPVGYLSSQIFYLLLPLLLSMFAVGLGSSLLAKEEQSNTIELLLSRPVSRKRLLAAKALAGLGALGLVGLASLVSVVVLAKVVNIEVGTAALAFTTVAAWLFAVLLGAIAFSLTAMGQATRRASIGLAALVGFVGYIATSFESKISWMVWVSRATPFHYYHPADMLGGRYAWGMLAGYLVVIGLLAVIGVRRFQRRDIG